MIKIRENDLKKIIAEVSVGNESVLEQCYDEYGKMLFALIFSIVKNRESAEEVLQDVLIAMVTHPPDRPIANAKGWLFKIIDNFSKNFLRYLSLKGYDVYVVRDVRFIPSNFKPHIYTKEETERYFKAVDNYSDLNRKNAIQYPVLFRILYCCGTRISETLSIRKRDIDLDKGII